METSGTNPPAFQNEDDPQAFPHLSDEMCERIAHYGETTTLAAHELVFERGQRSVDFLLVLNGNIEIFETDANGTPKVFTVHREKQFTGELDLFNDREILVSGRAGTESRVVRVKRDDFRRMVTSEPDIADILMRAFIKRRVGFIQNTQGAVVLVGASRSADTQRIQQFLTRNGYPYRLLDSEADPDAVGFLAGFDVKADQLPVVVASHELLLRNPSNAQIADQLGLSEEGDEHELYDLVVVGAGPAGLAAAVYGASEGLKTIVIESVAPGGQAGTSSRIENYLGFPTGVSGLELAGRAQTQAQKFGARLAVARTAVGIEHSDERFTLRLDTGKAVQSRAVVIATGARYRKLDLARYEHFEQQGSILYAATAMEGKLCSGEVIVVGGGNSAGQAALFLAGYAAHVHLLVRASGLSATMSAYLLERIENSSRITLHTDSAIIELHGDAALERVTWRDQKKSEDTTIDASSIFVMIGAEPNTDWLKDCFKLDDKGFIVTGRDAQGMPLASPYATTLPGVFAVGDVRSGSVKRVASSVGEGSVVVQAVHAFLHPNGV